MIRSAIIVAISLMISGAALADHLQVPHEIAGFVLGDPIASCDQLLKKESELPLRYQPYLRELQIKAMGGFKSGLIAYETCAQPGRIVRIKMKYADSSKSFFLRLLKRFKAKFGHDPEWRGDPFHITQAWKWSFNDGKGNRISMILQHNLKDIEEKRGNAVKLTLHSALDEARSCFNTRQVKSQPPAKMMDPIDWGLLIPK